MLQSSGVVLYCAEIPIRLQYYRVEVRRKAEESSGNSEWGKGIEICHAARSDFASKISGQNANSEEERSASHLRKKPGCTPTLRTLGTLRTLSSSKNRPSLSESANSRAEIIFDQPLVLIRPMKCQRFRSTLLYPGGYGVIASESRNCPHFKNE